MQESLYRRKCRLSIECRAKAPEELCGRQLAAPYPCPRKESFNTPAKETGKLDSLSGVRAEPARIPQKHLSNSGRKR